MLYRTLVQGTNRAQVLRQCSAKTCVQSHESQLNAEAEIVSNLCTELTPLYDIKIQQYGLAV